MIGMSSFLKPNSLADFLADKKIFLWILINDNLKRIHFLDVVYVVSYESLEVYSAVESILLTDSVLCLSILCCYLLLFHVHQTLSEEGTNIFITFRLALVLNDSGYSILETSITFLLYGRLFYEMHEGYPISFYRFG